MSSVGKKYTCGPQAFGNTFAQDNFFSEKFLWVYTLEMNLQVFPFLFFCKVVFFSKMLKMYLRLKMDLGKISQIGEIFSLTLNF